MSKKETFYIYPSNPDFSGLVNEISKTCPELVPYLESLLAGKIGKNSHSGKWSLKSLEAFSKPSLRAISLVFIMFSFGLFFCVNIQSAKSSLSTWNKWVLNKTISCINSWLSMFHFLHRKVAEYIGKNEAVA